MNFCVWYCEGYHTQKIFFERIFSMKLFINENVNVNICDSKQCRGDLIVKFLDQEVPQNEL